MDMSNFILFTGILLNTFIYSADSNIHSVSNGQGENTIRLIDKATSLPAAVTGKKETWTDLLSQPLEVLDKNLLLKTLWEALTAEEIRTIFGQQQTTAAFSKAVPNFDIALPKITHYSHHPRRKRHFSLDPSYSNSNGINYEGQAEEYGERLSVDSPKKLIKLNGFGQQFTLNVSPNANLLDPYFVHLHRHKNVTEILPQEHVRKQMACLYHGSASLQGSDEGSFSEQGSVALSLCDGMKGFILPRPPSITDKASDDDRQQFHYVIHPLPDRILKSAFPSEEPTGRKKNTPFPSAHADNEKHHRHHIILKRSGSPFPKLVSKLSTVQNILKTDRVRDGGKLPSRMHHDHTQNDQNDYGSGADDDGRREAGNYFRRQKRGVISAWHQRQQEANLEDTFKDFSNMKEVPSFNLTVEMAVFVDKDLYKHMQQNFPEDTQGEVTKIVLAMVNAVQLLFHDPSLGHRVDFVLKRLEVLESDPHSLIRPYDVDHFLTNFCKWQKSENPSSDGDPMHWDHALMLTGLDLYEAHVGTISNQVVGHAPIAGMCSRSSSCSVIEGRTFETVFAVAREIGHSLGMRNDGPQAENNCDPASHIMSPTLGAGKLTWSPCSKKYLDLFLATSQGKCLQDKAERSPGLDHDADGRLPGQIFDADRQCALKYGRGSFHAPQQSLEDICRELHCRREFFTWTAHPALDGTSCSPAPADDMRCRAGLCVPKTAAQMSSSKNSFGTNTGHQNGEMGWTDWKVQTDCKFPCIVPSKGVQLLKRKCTADDGLCTGMSFSVRLCKPDKHILRTNNGCPRFQTPFEYASTICDKYSRQVSGLSGFGMQLSPTKEDPDRSCRIGCQDASKAYIFYMVNGEEGWFPTGTDCSRGDKGKNAYCVTGKCVDFGDDNTYVYQLNTTTLQNSSLKQSINKKRQAEYYIK